jgi:tetratricopeptide (TPR) repeat protein
MKRTTSLLLAFCMTMLLPAAAMAAAANLKILIVNENGASIREALVLLSPVDDPSQQITIGENELGAYEGKVELATESAAWNIKKIVVDGYLPVRVSINSSAAGGEALQEIDGMALDPSIPIPPVKLAARGNASIELTMGEQQLVMERFRSGRAAARAQAEQEQADRLAAAEQNKDYATALKLHKEGDIEGSLPHFRKAIEQNPEDKDLQIMYTRVLYQAKRFDEFQEASKKALQLDPGNTELLMMLYTSHRSAGNMTAAFDALLEIKKAGGMGADLLPHLNFVAQSMKQNKGAVPAYKTVLEINPDDVDTLVALASIYAAAGDSALSEQYLHKAIALRPDKAVSLYYNMGTKILASKNAGDAELTRAAELFNKALEHDPSFAPAYKSLGLALWKMKDYAGTRRAFERYLELHPQAPDADKIEDYLSELPE